MKNRRKHYVKKNKPYHSSRPISKALTVSQDLYHEYANYRENCCHHHLLPLSRKQALEMAREFRVVPQLVSWLEKCSPMEYSLLYFYGMEPGRV